MGLAQRLRAQEGPWDRAHGPCCPVDSTFSDREGYKSLNACATGALPPHAHRVELAIAPRRCVRAGTCRDCEACATDRPTRLIVVASDVHQWRGEHWRECACEDAPDATCPLRVERVSAQRSSSRTTTSADSRTRPRRPTPSPRRPRRPTMFCSPSPSFSAPSAPSCSLSHPGSSSPAPASLRRPALLVHSPPPS
ncbi:hypothetical protein PsYK624_027290 [Phanerochaete sordida]|uniref:Uncharacterized protein n=1 Tax=Phanerochaete sordida TaxID=48140 RepID=A0A9P3G1Q2_9APHY|nr:hypothetical protein PsYK624_027290 [Phanerochaete sordida]